MTPLEGFLLGVPVGAIAYALLIDPLLRWVADAVSMRTESD